MNYSIELIRLVAVILITFTHTKHNIESGNLYFFIETIPKYGTVILSIVSGYLYWKITQNKPNLFAKKIRSLVIPYFIANLVVLIPVVLAYFIFGFSFLNRLSFDYTLFTTGLLSLDAPPINPPTYFIRDIFIIFVLIELVFRKNFKMLLIIMPLIVFGSLLLRFDILVLFVFGAFFAAYQERVNKKTFLLVLLILGLFIAYYTDYTRHIVAAFLFVLLIDWNIKFVKTGGFSYLLHLYHAPIIVLIYPILSKYIENVYWSISLQIGFALFFSYMLYLITRKIKILRILSGGR